MKSNTTCESRQTRRWRERQAVRHPAPSPRKPYVLLCRCEDAQGVGFSVMTEVDTPQEGDAVARDQQAAPDDVLGEMHLRCEVAVNTPEALHAWATANITRRDAVPRRGHSRKRD